MDPTVQLTHETHKQVILHTCKDLTSPKNRGPQTEEASKISGMSHKQTLQTLFNPPDAQWIQLLCTALLLWTSLKFWISVCSCHQKEGNTSNFWCQGQSNFQNEQQPVQFSVKKQAYHYLSSLELQDDTGSPHFLSSSSGHKHTRTPLHYRFWPSEQKITEGQNRKINCANMMKRKQVIIHMYVWSRGSRRKPKTLFIVRQNICSVRNDEFHPEIRLNF